MHRKSVSPLAGIAKYPASRDPRSPPQATPMRRSATQRRQVRWAPALAISGTRSAKIFHLQQELRQKKRRTCKLKCTLDPPHGRSASVRV
jgi:hypothetical protein